VKLSLVPLVLMLSATGWFAVRPGFGTFFLALFAFLLWASARFVEFLLKKTAQLRVRIEEHLGLSETPSPSVSPGKLPGDPRFQKLLSDLRRMEGAPELREQSRRALNQLIRLPELFGKFETLLKEKLQVGELTHERYQASGQRVYETTLAELREASQRMGELEAIARDSRGPSAQVALRQLRREQQEQIGTLLERSEKALTEMARINLAVAAMRGKSTSATPEFEEAIRDLRELADRAKRY
jgi:hypothetical protein